MASLWQARWNPNFCASAPGTFRFSKAVSKRGRASSWVRRLLRKVTLRRDAKIRAPDPETIGARVEVKLGDGRVFKEEVIYPPGHARNPLSEEGLRKKFFMLAENVLGKDRAAGAAEMALHAEELSNLEPLLDTLCAQPAL